MVYEEQYTVAPYTVRLWQGSNIFLSILPVQIETQIQCEHTFEVMQTKGSDRAAGLTIGYFPNVLDTRDAHNFELILLILPIKTILISSHAVFNHASVECTPIIV